MSVFSKGLSSDRGMISEKITNHVKTVGDSRQFTRFQSASQEAWLPLQLVRNYLPLYAKAVAKKNIKKM